MPTDKPYTAITADSIQLDTANWANISSVIATETLNSENAWYSISFDGRNEFKVWDATASAWRSIAKNDSGTWKYNSATSGNTTWVACTTNTANACVSEAMELNTVNRMTGTQLNAIADSSWETSGGFSMSQSTLDLAVTLFADTGATNSPEIDQIALDYTVNNPPTAPTALYVANTNAQTGTAGTSVVITSLNPHFSAIYNDPETGDTANKYQIQVDNNSDFSSPVWDSGTGITITEIAEGDRSNDIVYSGSTLTHNTTYYYKIKFWDELGEEGEWSTEEASFITDLNTAPSAPDTLRTESNFNPINLADTTPEFTAIYRDVDSGDIALKYRIQVNTSATFTGTTMWDSGASGTALSGTGCLVNTNCEEISYAGTQLIGGTTYYWRIKFWDTIGEEGNWSTMEATFKLETAEPTSQILYPRDGDDLNQLPKIIGTASDAQTAVDFVQVSIKDNSAGKWYNGSAFSADTETWLLAQGAENWSFVTPTWASGTQYTIRSRATDNAGNEEHTAEATFTFDTSNGEEGSVYAESIRVADETNYIVYFPVTVALNTGNQFEVSFDSGAYVFTGSLADADITVQSSSGTITASAEVIDSTGTTILSTITGSVAIGDVIEMHINNYKVKNPATTGVYNLNLKTYSGSNVLETGIADISISGQEVALNVQLQEALEVSVDSGAIAFSIDPDSQM